MRHDVVVALAGTFVLLLAEIGIRAQAAAAISTPSVRVMPRAELDVTLSKAPIRSVTIRRDGTVPGLNHAPVRRAEVPCRLEIPSGGLASLSDTLLKRRGMGASSPVVVQDAGRALTAGAAKDCDGTFRFRHGTIAISTPSNAPDAISVVLSPAVPLETADGPVWWVYPRTALAVDVPADAAAVGAATLTVSARALGQVRAPVTLRVHDTEVPLTGTPASLQATLPVTLDGDRWQATVTAPRGSNYVRVDAITLTVGDTVRDLLAEAQQ